MTSQSTELIWHFIGYLHIEELLKKPIIEFSGAYLTASDDSFIYSPAALPGRITGDTPDAVKPSELAVSSFTPDSPTLIDFARQSIELPAPFISDALQFLNLDKTAPQSIGPGGFGTPPPAPVHDLSEL